MNDTVHCTSIDWGLLHVLDRSIAANDATGTSNVRGCRHCSCVADHEDCRSFVPTICNFYWESCSSSGDSRFFPTVYRV